MSPTVRHESSTTDLDLDVVRRRHSTGAVRVYAVALLVVALGATAGLAAAGASFPAPGLLLLLAIPLALCMNRFVFFPNEVGVTADAAVVFAAMVGFRGDAPWLGPLLVALLVGPLDAKHWEERAFVRMAYNSGSTAIVTAATVAVFGAVVDALGASWLALAGAAAAAAVPYVLVESALGVILVALHGERAGAAVRHQLPVNTVAVPLALYGASAGFAGVEAGWWLAFAMLLPVPLVPELLLVELPRRCRGPHRARLLGVLGVTAGLAALALLLPFPPPATLAGLLVLSVLVGVETRVSARDPVPALAALVVVAAVVAVPGDARFLAAALVAVAATGAAWATRGTSPTWPALPRAATGALVGAVVFSLAGRGSELSTRGLVAATVAGMLSVLLTDRRPSTAVWCAPVIAAAAALALLGRELGSVGAVVFAAGIAVVMATASAWGSPPWRSRLLGRWSHRRLERARRGLLVVAGSGAAACAFVAGPTWALLGTACAEAAVAMAMFGVRQWRFAPRRRARDGLLLTLAALAATVGGAPGACVAAAAALVVGWAVARRRTTTAGSLDEAWQPENRSSRSWPGPGCNS